MRGSMRRSSWSLLMSGLLVSDREHQSYSWIRRGRESPPRPPVPGSRRGGSVLPVRALEGRRVVVIGGSSGIGFAVAAGAIREGAQVVVGSSSAARVEDAVKRLGPAASGSAVDAREEASV